MQKIKYNFSPSLLNQFSLFLTEEGYTKKDENGEEQDIPYVNYQKLIDTINKVPFETTEAQQKGIDFENDVIEYAQGNISVLKNKDIFYSYCVVEISDRLPDFFVAQRYISRQFKDILFYGFCDVTGGGRIIDIKTSSQVYSFGKFLNSHQNLYLWALQPQGFTTMEYLYTNFKTVYPEVYGLDYDFSKLFEQMKHFSEFVEDNKSVITNPKIFNYRYETSK
jgi:hypothetical protein